MRKFLVISVLCGITGPLCGCATLPVRAGGAPDSPPATPVFFQPLSAALDQPALDTIATAAKIANAEPAAPITVTGAADTIGSTTANALLSQTRAQVVADALVKDGVVESRISVKGIGATPAPSMAGASAQYSRRALIRIGP